MRTTPAASSLVGEDEPAFLSFVNILTGDEPTLQRPERRNAGQEDEGQAGDEMHPERRRIRHLDPAGESGAWNTSEAHDEERRTIGGVGKGEVEAAVRALFLQCQEAVENRGFAAARAESANTNLHRRKLRPLVLTIGAHGVFPCLYVEE